MKRYLLTFGHSPYGAHQYHFEAENDEKAKELAEKRMEQSCMVGFTYDLHEVRELVYYSYWKRQT